MLFIWNGIKTHKINKIVSISSRVTEYYRYCKERSRIIPMRNIFNYPLIIKSYLFLYESLIL